MRSTVSSSFLRAAVFAVPLIGLLADARTASADFREAAQTALAATVAVEWNEKEGGQAQISGLQSQVPRWKTRALDSDIGRRYLWVGAAGPSKASFSSGTIVDGQGLIVTFAADPDDAEPTVILPDGQSLPAKRVVLDNRSQLALLKVDAAELRAVPLAKERPEVGESVLTAMCVDTENRFVAKGIVAADKRNIDGFPFALIQTDIQVSPMGAGAPLVNEAGELVGVIVAMMAPDPNKGGPALAVPAEHVQALLDARTEHEEVFLEGGYLGISLDSQDGVTLVSSVQEDSPAAHVDIEPGDKILAIDDQAVTSVSDIMEMIVEKRAGDVVVLELERDAKPLKVRVRLGERPRPETTASQSPYSGSSDYRLEWFWPSKLYMLDKEGKVTTVAPKVREGSEYRTLAELQDAYADAIEQLAPPQTPVLRVERTELDQKLETLTDEVETLREQVKALTEQLKRLREHIEED